MCVCVQIAEAVQAKSNVKNKKESDYFARKIYTDFFPEMILQGHL